MIPPGLKALARGALRQYLYSLDLTVLTVFIPCLVCLSLELHALCWSLPRTMCLEFH